MLVLTRRTDETIMIGDPKKPEECIEVTVSGVKGDQVRIGVQAPRSVTVNRTKIWEQKRQERQSEALFEASPSELKADRVQ